MVAALLLVTSVVVPALGAADSSLSMEVEQQAETGETLVTVTQDGRPIDNVTLLVDASGNYPANGSDALGSNGTVTLPVPTESVNVTFTAEYDDTTVTERVTLVPLRDSLTVFVEQHADGSATLMVTQYGDPVGNATVYVTVGENDSYVGTGEYVTDQNGTLTLPAPETTIDVSLSAEYDNLTASNSVTLSLTELTVLVAQDDAGDVTITVTDDGEYVDGAEIVVVSENYRYTGTYTADNGTVSLPAPAENVSVIGNATAGNETDSTEATLRLATDENPNNDFAESLGRFINFLKTTDVNGSLAQKISAFVHEHNPAAADDKRGPPEHANGPT